LIIRLVLKRVYREVVTAGIDPNYDDFDGLADQIDPSAL
jgi:hypothetical protein